MSRGSAPTGPIQWPCKTHSLLCRRYDVHHRLDFLAHVEVLVFDFDCGTPGELVVEDQHKTLIVVTGPTGSGKTKLSIELSSSNRAAL